ncbi:hypothetical protein Nepgr_032320 [Nepenthes gracilis]|uniref:Protein kinase domain-containing protein n=1 Tax=Nepenthes gracilis TaxID=150966 RepID=A0AAD3Y5K0_NEPGR|nr:hypothetical protein Nepgr_032320 [Nepenthes gracilis]
MCWKFSYNEIKKAPNKISTVIGRVEFGEMYKAQFSNVSIAVVKHISIGLEQAMDEFYREIELLVRLHHRHLVALRGFCIIKQHRFLLYEFKEKDSLKDHFHSPSRALLSW